MFVSTCICRYAVPGSCVSGAICDGVNEGQLQHVPVHPRTLEPYHVVKMRLQECVCLSVCFVCVCENFVFIIYFLERKHFLCYKVFCIQRHGLEIDW